MKKILIYKKPQDLNKTIGLVKVYVITCAVLVFSMFLVFIYFLDKMKTDSVLNKIYIERQGLTNTFTALSLLSQEDAFFLESRDQIKYFIMLFYQFNAETIEKNRTQALSLCDDSGKRLEEVMDENNYTQDIIDLAGQSFVHPETLENNLQISDNNFSVSFVMTALSGKTRTNYKIKLTGFLEPTNRSKNNSHGILLKNLKQSLE